MKKNNKRKKITLAVIALLLISLGILTAIRWDAWFHNPEEQPYKAPDAPSRVLLTFGNEGENSRFVSWTCGDVVDKKACLYLVCDSDTIAYPATGEVFVSRSGKAAFYLAN